MSKIHRSDNKIRIYFENFTNLIYFENYLNKNSSKRLYWSNGLSRAYGFR